MTTAPSAAVAPTPPATSRPLTRAALPGLLVTLAVAVPATFAGMALPIVGGPVFGILFGIVLGVLLRRVLTARHAEALRPGYAVAGKHVLQLSIVVLGTGLSLAQVVHTGGHSLPVMIGTLTVALGGAWLLGRMLGIGGDTRLLIGTGTGICGASAIAAVTAVTGAAKAEVAYAIGTIFTFNIVAVLSFPAIGHLLGLSQESFGLWSGTAINDTSSVVAAAYSYGNTAGATAVVVKLTRALMIVPICLAVQWWYARKRRKAGAEIAHRPWWKLVPLFIVGFLAASALDSVGVIPDSWHPGLSFAGTFLITVALVGIGLSLQLADMRKAGHRPLLLGGLLWIAVSLTSLGLQAATGQL